MVMFAHRFGCDGSTWEKMLPRFTGSYQVVFDHVWAGGSDPDEDNPVKYATLDGYTGDVLEICETLDLQDATLVGHSVGGMMPPAAAVINPRWLGRFVLLASFPSYMDYPTEGYLGGFTVEGLAAMPSPPDVDHRPWETSISRGLRGAPNTPENAAELGVSFLLVSPVVAQEFSCPCLHTDGRQFFLEVTGHSMTLQCAEDSLIQDDLSHWGPVQLSTAGHYPQVSSSQESAVTMVDFIAAGISPQQVPEQSHS